MISSRIVDVILLMWVWVTLELPGSPLQGVESASLVNSGHFPYLQVPLENTVADWNGWALYH